MMKGEGDFSDLFTRNKPENDCLASVAIVFRIC